jgi:ribosomal protein S18 acetylase RimI-like enzyme
VQYRKATPADAGALAEFGARLFLDSYRHLMEAGEIEAYVRDHFTVERQQAELADAGTSTFLAVDPDICGYAQLAAGSRPDCELAGRSPAELKRIYVERAWQGRGVAAELLRLVEAEARERRCDLLWLAVWEINQRAISFYGKQGFAIVGRQGFPIGNEVQTDHVMAKPLATELQ